ncbi:MAG: FliH/SctL family protein [bacterium]
MYKNLYTSGEYNIKDTPYKLRGSFLSKAVKVETETAKPPQTVTPEEKKANVDDEYKVIALQVEQKKEELSSLEKLNQDLKESAQAEIAVKLQVAAEQAEALKIVKEKEGYEAGFEKGYFEGLEKGKAETNRKYMSLINALTAITEMALSEKQKIIKNTEDDIVNLAIDIAQKVVGKELVDNKEIVVKFVTDAIKMLENKEKIIIYCNPEDLEIIKLHRNDFVKLTDINETLHILPDDMLERGECRLESDSEIVDTDINYQFGEIKKKLHSAV